MSTTLDGRELNAPEFLALMRSDELAGNREYDDLTRSGLVLCHGIWMTRDTAAVIGGAL